VSEDHVIVAVGTPEARGAVSEIGRAIDALFASSNPASTMRTTVLPLWREAWLREDQAALNDMREGYFRNYMEHGVDGFLHVMQGLAGHSYELFDENAPLNASQNAIGKGVTPSLSVDGGSGSVSEGKEIVPLTVIYVNGMFNNSPPDQVGEALLPYLDASPGLMVSRSTDYMNPRSGAPIRMIVHHNPIVEPESDISDCMIDILFNLAVARLGHIGAGVAWTWSRIIEDSSCSTLSDTNLRVFEQYVEAMFLGNESLSDHDRHLRNLVESERARNGGRSVIVIGHSQGTMIGSQVLSGLSAPEIDMGCVAGLSLGSPLSPNVGWGANVTTTNRIIARGTRPLTWDIVYPLGGNGRSDAAPSASTDSYDRGWWARSVLQTLVMQKKLHMVDEYLNPVSGFGEAIHSALRKQRNDLGSSCGGVMTGTIFSLGSGDPVEGALVEFIDGDEVVDAVTTGTDGRFKSGSLLPVSYTVRVSAEGYEGAELKDRLAPFNSFVEVQEGGVFLGVECVGDCAMEGDYSSRYQISAVIGDQQVSCTFYSTISVTQEGDSFSGVITTSQRQTGCQGGNRYIYWDAGTTEMTEGLVRSNDISFIHHANPPWEMNGEVYEDGFRASTLWVPNEIAYTVEMVAARTPDSAQTTQMSIEPTESPGSRTGPEVRRY